MSEQTIAGLGELIGNTSRTTMLLALVSGQALTAGELAATAGVAASTASEHLGRLLDANLVALEAQGRHRYYRLASREIAEALELLANLPLATDTRITPRAPSKLRRLRSCYDHLAGELAVAFTDHLLEHGLVTTTDHTISLTPTGADRFEQLGLDPDALRSRRRPLLRLCLDWTERRHHLAGALPAELLRHGLDQRWFTRNSRNPRALTLTSHGTAALRTTFAFTPVRPRPPPNRVEHRPHDLGHGDHAPSSSAWSG